MRNGTNQMCLFWAKNNFDRLLWGKQEGDGRQLSLLQSMGSGFSAACLGPFATGPFDVVKVCQPVLKSSAHSFSLLKTSFRTMILHWGMKASGWEVTPTTDKACSR